MYNYNTTTYYGIYVLCNTAKMILHYGQMIGLGNKMSAVLKGCKCLYPYVDGEPGRQMTCIYATYQVPGV